MPSWKWHINAEQKYEFYYHMNNTNIPPIYHYLD